MISGGMVPYGESWEDVDWGQEQGSVVDQVCARSMLRLGLSLQEIWEVFGYSFSFKQSDGLFIEKDETFVKSGPLAKS
jgi:hypothetical protein